MKINEIVCFLLALCPFVTLAESSTSSTSECVGALTVIFPGPVEVAANTADMLIKEHNIASIQPQFRFVDGELAGWTSIVYGGNVFISHVLNERQKAKLIASQKQLLIAAKNSKKENKDNSYFKAIDVGARSGFAAQVGPAFTASLFLQDHMIWRQSIVTDASVTKSEADYRHFLNTVEYRNIGVIPNIPGLCLPYFFIPAKIAGEKIVARIASTYRLKNHPDITIWIEDSNSGDFYGNKNIEKSKTPIYQVNDFWSQYEIIPGISKIESEWHLPAGRRVKINGGEGIASFVKIKRKSGVVDYGYMAVIQGDDEDSSKAQSAKFYVIRNSEISLGKNIKPVNKDEFLKISAEIASKIKRNEAH